MGNDIRHPLDCCVQTPAEDHSILVFAIAHAPPQFKHFLIHNRFLLNDLIRVGLHCQVSLDQYDVVFSEAKLRRLGKPANSDLDAKVGEVYLPCPYELLIVERQRRAYQRQQGLILTPNCCFHGEFEKTALHGEGTCLYLDKHTQAIKKTVKGRWHHNRPLELNIYNQQAVLPLLTISFIDAERQAKVTLPDRTTYFGSIRFSDATSIEQIMTGKGVINFPNRNMYIGEVRNGLMHTQAAPAYFTSKAEKFSYTGHYANGYREGTGSLTFEFEAEEFTIKCEWKRGRITEKLQADMGKKFRPKISQVHVKHGRSSSRQNLKTAND